MKNKVKFISIGKINNWNQVGGPNLPIKPYLRRIHDGNILTTTGAFKKIADSLGGVNDALTSEIGL